MGDTEINAESALKARAESPENVGLAQAPAAPRGSEHLFIHLSDIHFRWPKHGVKYELDDDLRNELERDARKLASELGTPSAVLITGDIAFSAAPDEYKLATDWLLKKIFDATGCPGENICCIPGNHDVDWSEIRKSKSIRDCHAVLRKEELHLLDGTIQEYLSDPFVFYRALENYNKFALQFGCDISTDSPFWDRDFRLNDGSTLRIRGANSTLISDEDDDIRTGDLLVLGSHQCKMLNEDGVEHMFLCHHPPQWLIDSDEVDKRIARARVQMFGHKHEQKLTEIDGRLRVAAGAVHPDRKERGWKPRYNWMRVAVRGVGDSRTLAVVVHPRVWGEKNQFVPDYEACEGKESRAYKLPIDSWTSLGAVNGPPPGGTIAAPSGRSNDEMGRTPPSDSKTRVPMDPARTLAHRFLSLPFVGRMEVAQALKLLREEDGDLIETERSKRIFARAKEDRKLADLWEEVEKRHADGKHTVNPFGK